MLYQREMAVHCITRKHRLFYTYQRAEEHVADLRSRLREAEGMEAKALATELALLEEKLPALKEASDHATQEVELLKEDMMRAETEFRQRCYQRWMEQVMQQAGLSK